MPSKALAGTVAAHQRCATCGHARIRHEAHGIGRCTTLMQAQDDWDAGRATIRWGSCTCTQFTEGD